MGAFSAVPFKMKEGPDKFVKTSTCFQQKIELNNHQWEKLKGKINSKLYLINDEIVDVNAMQTDLFKRRKKTNGVNESSGYYPNYFKSIYGML